MAHQCLNFETSDTLAVIVKEKEKGFSLYDPSTLISLKKFEVV